MYYVMHLQIVIFMGKILFDKAHPGIATKTSSKCFLKSSVHPQKCLDFFTNALSSLDNPCTMLITCTPKTQGSYELLITNYNLVEKQNWFVSV